ncbi:hypothetical protein [Bergeyella cardium]|uniref:Uncharacterized protein n=1 Tax=Bergeyella cardium TaxID=1585976 RepID=A0A6P1QXL9_9FLAO|nr:hypothetical protein [Bergeyella cardium]QHN65460.1 hypothetical protein DBX24_05980 [Bergeyella cardium]WHE33041.1 hypothetical protein P8603_06010 [Bergeyella cardium]WHF59691.1 hypothetical protein O0R51_06010 [Bergeyella cardium]
MNKTFKIYGIILAVVLVLLALLEVNKTEVVSWKKTYGISDKNPFGLYIFSQEIDALFGSSLEKESTAPYIYYNKEKEPHNIILIQQNMDKESCKKILKQVEKGSDALIFSDEMDYFLADTLHIGTSWYDFDGASLHFTDKKLKDKAIIDKLPSRERISYITKEQQILGYATFEGKETGVNFIKVPFGKGNIYLHTEPLVLTNYSLLKGEANRQYVEKVFSYLPERKTVWFMERKLFNESTSPLRFILANPPLRYAWWLFLGGVFLFLFFNAKRKQRIIPIIEPKKNKSVEFVKSIGNLYLNEGDFQDMMSKKAQYFLNRVRTELLIDTHHLDEHFAKRLHLKTGKPLQKITEAIALIKKAQDEYAYLTKEDLVKMNEILDEILR